MLLSPLGASASSSIRCRSKSMLYVFHFGMCREENEVLWKGNMCHYKLKCMQCRELRNDSAYKYKEDTGKHQ